MWELMAGIELPAELELPALHGKLPWIVRTIWEEHAGWFRYEATAELYDVPASGVWDDLAELAGETALVERARRHLTAGKPLHALHLSDIALATARRSSDALEVRIEALTMLLENGGSANFSEQQWLKSEIAAAQAAR